MEQVIKFGVPIALIAVLTSLYIWFLLSRRQKAEAKAPQVGRSTRRLPQRAPVIPYMEPILVNFYEALKQALPDKYLIYVNVPIEKLFDPSKRDDLCMKGQYADFVVFTQALMPILVIDLFDMTIINLDRVNRIKTASKEIIRNSGIPVLDYQYEDNCNIDELRRKIADTLNPLRTSKNEQ